MLADCKKYISIIMPRGELREACRNVDASGKSAVICRLFYTFRDNKSHRNGAMALRFQNGITFQTKVSIFCIKVWYFFRHIA
ncbi:hypothetical protein EGI32_06205 [Ferruginibacter sp. HRS2-29]|nr:hypothetical protein [Ferruginibacter sp. HRS2-29]